jgi:hypothetical protein
MPPSEALCAYVRCMIVTAVRASACRNFFAIGTDTVCLRTGGIHMYTGGRKACASVNAQRIGPSVKSRAGMWYCHVVLSRRCHYVRTHCVPGSGWGYGGERGKSSSRCAMRYIHSYTLIQSAGGPALAAAYTMIGPSRACTTATYCCYL